MMTFRNACVDSVRDAPKFILALALSAAACLAGAPKRDGAGSRPRHAVDVVVEAFQTHPLVALSEGASHGQLETRNFFAALIRDRRFTQAVRHIVVEFGNARYQPVVDRYVSGASVTRDELRRVWEDTTQVSGVWSLPMYEQMLADVRSVNGSLPAGRRIRILLGDPPIDWTKITSPADEDMNDWRDAHFAHVVEREIMSRGEKALLLIGGAHISRKVILPNSLIHLLDARFPGKTWVIGVLDAGRVNPRVATRLQDWTVPAGVSVRRTWLGKLDVREIGFDLSRGAVEDDVDALLILSSATPRSDEAPQLETKYAVELSRRRALADATLPFRGGKIRFEEERADFTTDSNEPLQEVLKELLRDRGLRLLVKAFADPTEITPEVLSQHRAEALVDWLSQRQVARDRLVAKGCGATRLLTFGETAAARAMNRRAELVRLTPTAGCEPPW